MHGVMNCIARILMCYSVQSFGGLTYFLLLLLDFEFENIDLCMVNMMPTLETLFSVCVLEFDCIKFDHCMNIMILSLKKLFLYGSVNLPMY